MSSQNHKPWTLESIESALNQIGAKKQSLKKAFEELQSQTSLTSSLSLSWPDLDAHFTSIQHSLTRQFRLLQSLENPPQNESPPSSASSSSNWTDPSEFDPKEGYPFGSKGDRDVKGSVLNRVDPKDEDPSGEPVGENSGRGELDGDLIRAELRGLCERMDGNGLRDFMNKGWDVRDKIRVALVDAMECASDPALLVLDAVEIFFAIGAGKRTRVMRGCKMLLETLVEMRSVEVSGGVRKRAKRLVLEWKKKEKMKGGRKKFQILLTLLGSFRLRSELSMEEFIDHLAVAKPQQASKLCRLLGFGENIIEIIHKLLSKNVPLLALDLIYNFELTAKFPPVPLMNLYIIDSKERAKKVYVDANNARWAKTVAISLELNVLKAVVKFIKNYNLESEYPQADLEKVIEQLEKQKADSKRPAAAPSKAQQLHHDSMQIKKQKRQRQLLQNGDPGGENTGMGDSGGISCRGQLRGLCERMDGDGLREYIDEGWDEREQSRIVLVDAMKCASDPALLVLDAVWRFFATGTGKKTRVMRACQVLLETLVEMRNVEVRGEVRERARRLVLEWKKKENTKQGKKFHVMVLLILMGAFRLGSKLSLEEFVDHLAVGKPQQASKLCLLLGFGEYIIDIIQQLLSKNLPLLALDLICNFELTDKFSPALLLNSYIMDSKKRAKKVYGDAHNARWAKRAAISLELNVLKAVVKFIGDHNLQSKYPCADLEKEIEQLEKQKADSKRPIAAPFKPQQLRHESRRHNKPKRQQQPPQSGNKRPRIIPLVEPREHLLLHQSHSGSAGLLPDHYAPYSSSPAVPYGLAHGVVPLMGTSVGIHGSARTAAGIYGSSGVPTNNYGDQIPASSQLYVSESNMPSDYYDRLIANGGCSSPPQHYLPNYHH